MPRYHPGLWLTGVALNQNRAAGQRPGWEGGARHTGPAARRWLRGQESNLRLRGYESRDLPLIYLALTKSTPGQWR